MSVKITVEVPQAIVDEMRPRSDPDSEWRTKMIFPLDLWSRMTMMTPITDKWRPPVMTEFRFNAYRYVCRCGSQFWWWSAGDGDDTEPRCKYCECRP